ncbi:MAG: response regulator [bacterium]|nr:response regulator [bacterium]
MAYILHKYKARAKLPKTGQDKLVYLVIDDNQEIYELIKRIYSSHNFIYCDNGLDGLIKAIDKENKIEAVFLDYNMPKQNGLETLKRIRLQKPDLPIFMMSGNPEIKEKALSFGATKFLEKPFDLLELTGLLSIREITVTV